MQVEDTKIAVVKVGGDMLLDKADMHAFAQNIRGLVENNWSCIVMHGGGPQINRLQKLHGLTAQKIEGRRVTRPKDLRVVKQALCGEVNVNLVAALLAQKVNAFGCHGASALICEAKKRPPMEFSEAGLIDLGEVGDVVDVNARLLFDLLNLQLTPVIASLGADREGRTYNINADTTAAVVARSVKADLLILCTKVGAIFKNINDKNSRIEEITPQLAEHLIEDKVITDGMIPKVKEAMALLHQGVDLIAIANADKVDNFLALSEQKSTIGTRFLKD